MNNKEIKRMNYMFICFIIISIILVIYNLQYKLNITEYIISAILLLFPIIFISNSKIVFVYHIIWAITIFLIPYLTNNKIILFVALGSIISYYISEYIYKFCYINMLQLGKINKKIKLFNEDSFFVIISKYILIFNVIVIINKLIDIKLIKKKILNTILNTILYILFTVVVFLFIVQMLLTFNISLGKI